MVENKQKTNGIEDPLPGLPNLEIEAIEAWEEVQLVRFDRVLAIQTGAEQATVKQDRPEHRKEEQIRPQAADLWRTEAEAQ